MVDLNDDDIKEAMIKLPQGAVTNMSETCAKIDSQAKQ